MSAIHAIDLLVAHADWLITMDDGRRIYRDGAVAIRDGRIVDVGKSADLVPRYDARRTIDAAHHVVTPGLVDSHIHTAFHLSRGLADEVSSQKFLFERMYPYEGLLGEDESYWSAALCVLELLRNGVTTFVDPGNYLPHVSVRVAGEAGVRCVMSRSTLDVARSAFGKLPDAFMETTEQCLERSERFVQEWHGAFDGRVRAWFQFRGVNNATDALITGLKDLADRYGVGVQTHACFAKETMEASLSGHGVPEVERLARLGVLDRNVLLVHGGWFTPREVKLVVDADARVVCSPSSSMHNGYGTLALGKIPELLELGVTVGLGSDHASSGIVDLLQEMFLASAGYKETRLSSTVMPPERALEMATVNGARCALWDDEIGSLTTGRRADLVLFDTRRAQWQPLYNPVANLVYSANGASTDVVIVGGVVLVDQGRVLSMDEDRVYAEVSRLMPGILSKTGLAEKVRPRWPIL
ncbi:MAG: amidohydrolase family protein [Candidatus Rokubacteria bacterium]|nr:amidohydrolase family protein [Candidatus Rokubacteria bacterium]